MRHEEIELNFGLESEILWKARSAHTLDTLDSNIGLIGTTVHYYSV
jgi:hypothetical protein